MPAADPTELDTQVRTLCEQKDFRAAATLVLGELGPDVLRITYARLHDENATSEVFSEFAENLWTALPTFQFRCSVRAFAFTVARNATSRYLDRDLRKQRAGVPLSQVPEFAEQAESLKQTTLAHLRTENHDRVTELRKQLSEEEQLVLTLHVDKNLGFNEIAVVTLGDEEADAEAIRKEAARLRKRFQLVKEKLRRLLGHTKG